MSESIVPIEESQPDRSCLPRQLGRTSYLKKLNLEQLRDAVNAENTSAVEAAQSALEHAIRAGEILLEIRSRTAGRWQEWSHANLDFGHHTASTYMRLASYQEHIAAGELTSIRAAVRSLRGLPAAFDDVSIGKKPTHLRGYAEELRSDGASWQKIADEVGVSASTVRRWLDPETEERYKERWKAKRAERRRAQDALRREERAKELASKASGPVSNAYALVRKTALSLDAAAASVEGEQARRLRSALQSVYEAEDELVSVIRLAREEQG